jgi:uncharacterized metal-binding protein
MKRIFRYIENLWVGKDRKPSIKSVLAIVFSINFLKITTYAVYRWEAGKSLSDLALVLGIEAGFIAALLGLTTYSNIQHKMMEKDKPIVDNANLGPEE